MDGTFHCPVLLHRLLCTRYFQLWGGKGVHEGSQVEYETYACKTLPPNRIVLGSCPEPVHSLCFIKAANPSGQGT